MSSTSVEAQTMRSSPYRTVRLKNTLSTRFRQGEEGDISWESMVDNTTRVTHVEEAPLVGAPNLLFN